MFRFSATDALTLASSSESFSRILIGMFGFWATDCLTRSFLSSESFSRVLIGVFGF